MYSDQYLIEREEARLQEYAATRRYQELPARPSKILLKQQAQRPQRLAVLAKI